MVKSTVVITHAPLLDYTRDYVSLPREYGTTQYDQRADIRAVNEAVWQNLADLDSRIHFTDRIRNRKVLIKPNLVCVFHNLGMRERDYPESTDPRVIDAVVVFLQRYTDQIIIVEGSGRGFPTRGAFQVSGLDRMAKLRGIQLIALEEQPVDRYILPKAKVMREMVIPRIFSEVVRGEAFYISIPKMKTNLYAGVTLGFKNAMGTLSYNLRQRNHTHDLDQKLVDMLHLFKADLTIIDGLVGGEGNCPAPVEVVRSGVIISGNHSVETDRVATRMMGFDLQQVKLMRIADKNGFADPDVEVFGEERVIPFKPADPSLMGEWMRENFPNVRILLSFTSSRAPLINEDGHLDIEKVCHMENVCRGGCLAATRYAFDMFHYEGQRKDFQLTLLIGNGVLQEGERVYFNREGKPWTKQDIAALRGKKLAVGSCTRLMQGVVDRYIDGCMPYPNAAHQALHLMTGTLCRVMSLRNRSLLPLLVASVRSSAVRKKLICQGECIDIPLGNENRIYEPRKLTAEEMQREYILEPFAPLTSAERRSELREEDRAFLATFLP